MVRFILQGISHPIQLHLQQGLNTLGRNPANSHPVPEASISSFHCEIDIRESDVVLRDLQSTNGTFVDDRPVAEARVEPGSTLRLGTLGFRLQREEFEIKVPELPKTTSEPARLQKATLPDGTPACSRNPALAATHLCRKCDLPFHSSNLRGVRLTSGSRQLLFCPECDSPCDPLGPESAKPKKTSLFGKLSQTLFLGRKK